MTRYATSTGKFFTLCSCINADISHTLDPRGYIPVFEYSLNNQSIMIDCETGFVHLTGIWKVCLSFTVFQSESNKLPRFTEIGSWPHESRCGQIDRIST